MPTPRPALDSLVSSQLRLSYPNQDGSRLQRHDQIAPKLLIISMFGPEADVWYENLPGSGLGDLYAMNVSIPGLSPRYPAVHCTAEGTICQVTTGEAEINAAATVTSVVLSRRFDLRKTYFLVAGVAGVNPKHASLGSVAVTKYAVQVALQYEIDAREMPAGWSTGYFPYGTQEPGRYPTILYGTEVFELNAALRDLAYHYASGAKLEDSSEAKDYRARYAAAGPVYAMATRPPSVVRCDSVTSDVYFTGRLLSDAFEDLTLQLTNGAGTYCMSAQEENAILAVLVRLATSGLVDYSRAIVLRTGANFDRPPPGVGIIDHLRGFDQNGLSLAVANLYRTGLAIAQGILGDWGEVFESGVVAPNYLGDILGTLGGQPDFGPGEHYERRE
ncbi:NUP-domain-containing protein [Xylaria palmicola]|nr:NUP-domain-containing protein [Xylaria palmicola]